MALFNEKLGFLLDAYIFHDQIHWLRTPREEIVFTAWPKIHYHPTFRYGRSIFCMPHQPNFSDIFDLCLHWVSVVHAQIDQKNMWQSLFCLLPIQYRFCLRLIIWFWGTTKCLLLLEIISRPPPPNKANYQTKTRPISISVMGRSFSYKTSRYSYQYNDWSRSKSAPLMPNS